MLFDVIFAGGSHGYLDGEKGLSSLLLEWTLTEIELFLGHYFLLFIQLISELCEEKPPEFLLKHSGFIHWFLFLLSVLMVYCAFKIEDS